MISPNEEVLFELQNKDKGIIELNEMTLDSAKEQIFL